MNIAMKIPSLLMIAFACTSTLVACGGDATKKADTTPPIAEIVSGKPAALPRTLEEAVANPTRSAANRARDPYRHPLETLTFFGVKPGQTVLEISPGRGWYTEILAPMLADNGQYIVAVPEPGENEYMRKMVTEFNEWMRSNSALGGKGTAVTFDLASDDVIRPAVQADVVLTFRNVHNWVGAKAEQKAFKAFFLNLKPGGALGVVEHRASETGKLDPKSGYMKTSEVIRLAKNAGFKLEAQSEINANPKDTKDHPEGVWTLPPNLRLGEKDREKYVAIGESDRMTLLFRKPLEKSKKTKKK